MSVDQLHAYRIQQAASVKVPYIGLAVALIGARGDGGLVQVAGH